MGFKVGWVASKDIAVDELESFYNLSRTGSMEEFPDFSICSTVLENGWSIIYFNEFLSNRLEELVLRQLSERGEIVSFQAHDGIMTSMISTFKAGSKVWSIVREPSDGKGWKEEGLFPEQVQAIKSKITKELLEEDEKTGMVDYLYSIPEDMGLAIVGFIHNRNTEHFFELT